MQADVSESKILFKNLPAIHRQYSHVGWQQQCFVFFKLLLLLFVVSFLR